MNRIVEKTSKAWFDTAAMCGAYMVAISFGVILHPAYWLVWLGLALFGLTPLVNRRAGGFSYRCPSTGEAVHAPALIDLVSPHGTDSGAFGVSHEWRLVRCPVCGRLERVSVDNGIKIKAKRQMQHAHANQRANCQ